MDLKASESPTNEERAASPEIKEPYMDDNENGRIEGETGSSVGENEDDANNEIKSDFKRFLDDKILPIILMTSLGLFGWAIRGQSGFGAIPGCLFAGTLWATTWYYLGHDPGSDEKITRRYNSGWTVLAIIFGIAISGMQGWMVWPQFIRGIFYMNDTDYFTINPAIGYLWWFIVALHWSGIGAILLVWTDSLRNYGRKDWLIRILCIVLGGLIMYLLYRYVPQLFLPHYDSGYYDRLDLYPNLLRIKINHMEAIVWFGIWCGGLIFEIIKKDWDHVKLILLISILTGILWMFFQYIWMIWVPINFPDYHNNLWRCWESSAGGAIGFSYGLAFVLFNKPLPPSERKKRTLNERYRGTLIGVYLATIFAMAENLINAIKGTTNLYLGLDEIRPSYAIPIVILAVLIFIRRWIGMALWKRRYIMQEKNSEENSEEMVIRSKDERKIFGLSVSNWTANVKERSPSINVIELILIVYILTRMMGLLVTGPLSIDAERSFLNYYLFLSAIDLSVILHRFFRIEIGLEKTSA